MLNKVDLINSSDKKYPASLIGNIINSMSEQDKIVLAGMVRKYEEAIPELQYIAIINVLANDESALVRGAVEERFNM